MFLTAGICDCARLWRRVKKGAMVKKEWWGVAEERMVVWVVVRMKRRRVRVRVWCGEREGGWERVVMEEKVEVQRVWMGERLAERKESLMRVGRWCDRRGRLEVEGRVWWRWWRREEEMGGLREGRRGEVRRWERVWSRLVAIWMENC